MSDTENKERLTENKKDHNSVKKEIISYIKMIIAVVAIVIILENFIIINAKIPSESMENTVMAGDRIFGSRLSYLFSDPERYDIVIFRYPDNESQLFIKRIIGLPGETVTIRDGKVYINDPECTGEPLTDSFCPEVPADFDGEYVVPEDSYFMLGDNRNHSKDSRYWVNTFVNRKKILGKAVFRYWPLTTISIIHGGEEDYYYPEKGGLSS